ncbi:MAG: hypothetical protein QF652_08200, partial [Dehalococcoidia bacterium]|nr:hypothetical protein [Dehalococcoidia bacterium]
MANEAVAGPRERGYIGIGLLGMGVVGVGLVRALATRSESLIDNIGLPVKLTRVLVRDTGRNRGVDVDADLLT